MATSRPPRSSSAPTRGPGDPTFVDHDSRPPGAPLPPGTRIDRYVIVQEAGTGGMGAVYVAFDSQLARRVAIKVVRPDVNTPDARARLLGEAQTMARLTHRNVVAVHDVGPFGDDVFLAMEYIDGVTLKEWLATSHPWRETLATLVAAGEGLAAAHAAGIVHRDFKPGNVLIGKDGRVVVSDFGIARAEHGEVPVGGGAAPSLPVESTGAQPQVDLYPRHIDASSRVDRAARSADAPSGVDRAAHSADAPSAPSLGTSPSSFGDHATATGTLVGTVGYMSPERAFEGRDDARSDQFSFCAALYLALYGRHPFPHRDLSSYLEALCRPALPPPAGTRVPAWVGSVLLRGLKEDPAARFASMRALLDALERDPGPRRRRVVGAFAVLAIASVAALVQVQRSRARERACRDEGEGVVAAWSPQAQEAVRAAFARSGATGDQRLWDATRAGLDDYARRWRATAVEACRATTIERTQTEPVLRRRRACLRTRVAEMAQLTRALADADAKLVQRAQDVVARLSPLDACSDPDELISALDSPTDPALESRVAELRSVIAEAKALKSIDHDVDAMARVAPVVTEARRIGFAPLLAEALLEQGRSAGRGSDAEPALVEAYRSALASRRFQTAGHAAAELTDTVGYVMGRHKDGHAWARLGEAALGSGSSREADDARTMILMSETGVYSDEEDAVAAVDAARRAAEIASRHHDPDDALFERIHVATGAALITSGDADGARREFQAALAASERRFGPDHPRVADDLAGLATIEIADGRYDVALQELDRAVAIDATIRGAGHVNTAIYLLDRAQASHMLGACEEAIADAAHAGRLYTEEQGPDFLDLMITETIAADCHHVLGHEREAALAIENAERIAATSTEAEGEASAEMRFVHAKIVAAKDPRRAVALAKRAREHYTLHAKTRTDRAIAAAIDAWLAERRIQ